jgi:hypothetical protein
MEEIIKNDDGTFTIKKLGSERNLDKDAVEAELGSINDELYFMEQRTQELLNKKQLLEG